jgi:hypothetical protein
MSNNVGDDATQLIHNALEINRNFLKIWTQRKHFLTFLSQLSNTLSPGDVNVMRVNVVNFRRVLELEEMKREIANFL